MYKKFLYSMATLIVAKFSKYVKQLVAYLYSEYKILILIKPIIKEYELVVWDFNNHQYLDKTTINTEKELKSVIVKIILEHSIKKEDLKLDEEQQEE